MILSAKRMGVEMDNCKHLRTYAWFAHDGTLCICCNDCGCVLLGGLVEHSDGTIDTSLGIEYAEDIVPFSY